MGLWKSLKKIVAKVSGADDAAKKAAEQVKLMSAGANEDVRKKMAGAMGAAKSAKRSRSARGRDSTIIAAGSQIQSRTLLG